MRKSVAHVARDGRGWVIQTPLAERFFWNVDKDGPTMPGMATPCWLWTGSLKASGQGQIGLNANESETGTRRPVPVPRVAFFLAHGRWPQPHALLRCRNPACARPGHAFEGHRDEHHIPARTKPCRKCDGTERDRFGYCVQCRRDRDRARNATEARRLQHGQSSRKCRYGLSPAAQDALFASQDGRCAICREPLDRLSKSTHLDHDHDTSRVRGFLCRDCNHAVGNLHESEERALRLVEYLRRHRTQSQ